jgi:hypothetical protein
MNTLVTRNQHLALRMSKGILTDKESVELFLEYVNNFITVSGFAEHYGVDEKTALAVIVRGNFLSNKE